MTEYCNKVLPQAEYLKKQLLDQYKQEHDAYLENQSRMQAIAIANAAKNEEENSKYGGLSKDTQRGSLIQPRETELAPSSQLPFGGVEYSPKTTGEGSKPANLYGIYNEADNTHYLPKDSGSELISPNPTPTAPSFDRSIKPHRFITSISTGIRPLVIPAELAQTFLRHVQLNTSKNVESCGLLTGKIVCLYFIRYISNRTLLFVMSMNFMNIDCHVVEWSGTGYHRSYNSKTIRIFRHLYHA